MLCNNSQLSVTATNENSEIDAQIPAERARKIYLEQRISVLAPVADRLAPLSDDFIGVEMATEFLATFWTGELTLVAAEGGVISLMDWHGLASANSSLGWLMVVSSTAGVESSSASD
jgi:hypothetical protein